ncbi:MAG: hypothetical protein ACHQZR_07855, partial [Candidatus Limnocylindrales bacterium]
MTLRGNRTHPGSAILTFLIADVRGYTAFTRTAGDEAAARLAASFAELVREGVEAFGGDVIELRGDEALAVFGSARSALRSAVELQRVFRDETAIDPTLPLGVGIGLDAGEAVPVEDGYRGAALNLAARLCAAAGAGEVLSSEGVVHLAGALDGLTLKPRQGLVLKGVGDAITALQVVVPAAPAPLLMMGAPSDLPPELDPLGTLFGRDPEARWLRWAWRTSRGSFVGCRVVTGPAGSGRTRLVAEVASLAVRDGGVVAYASGARTADDVEAVIHACTEQHGDPRPLLVVLDDIEVADAATSKLLDRLATSLVDRAGLLVVTAGEDPSAATERALWRIASPIETRHLEALGADAIAAIMRTYLPDAGEALPVEALAQASEGLPGRVHALASDWAQGEVTHRLGGATSRAAAGRRDLRRLEADVATNLIDLQLARERFRLLAPGAEATRGGDLCPFMGLASFDVADADIFFGRERLVAEMVGRLAGGSFLGVVGPSGSGKSSAVRAGLMPALESGALPATRRWIRVLLRPGDDPLRELDRVVFAALDGRQRAALAEGTDPLDAAARVLSDDTRLLVVVDQFEELFTTTTDPAARAAFIAALVQAVDSGRATVIVAVRADFYGRCAEHEELAALLAANQVLVGPMSAEEYRRAIDGPARRSGLRVEPALVDRLVADVVDQPGGLPLLSTALV